MSVIYKPKPNPQTPRRSYRNAKMRQALLIAIRNRQALENGGLERLDVADLIRRLAERKVTDVTSSD